MMGELERLTEEVIQRASPLKNFTRGSFFTTQEEIKGSDDDCCFSG
jgi:hypothetical protein